MAALTAASWTKTLVAREWVGNRLRVSGTLALPGTDTYPNDGIPLPAKEQYGFARHLEEFSVFGVNGAAGTVSEYMVRYDKTNNKLFLFEEEAAAAGGPLLECDTAEVPGPRTWNFVAWGW